MKKLKQIKALELKVNNKANMFEKNRCLNVGLNNKSKVDCKTSFNQSLNTFIP